MDLKDKKAHNADPARVADFFAKHAPNVENTIKEKNDDTHILRKYVMGGRPGQTTYIVIENGQGECEAVYAKKAYLNTLIDRGSFEIGKKYTAFLTKPQTMSPRLVKYKGEKLSIRKSLASLKPVEDKASPSHDTAPAPE
ncbi:MAG: hypothetical protein ACRBDI_07395 [Alphaproteobacteria bacterium]